MADNDVSIGFGGTDDGLSDVIQGVQQKLQTFNDAAAAVDFTPIANAGQSFDSLSTSVQGAAQSGQSFAESATTIAASATDQTSALAAVDDQTQALAASYEQTTEQTAALADASTNVASNVGDVAPAAQAAAEQTDALGASQAELLAGIAANTEALATLTAQLEESGGKLGEHSDKEHEAAEGGNEFLASLNEVAGSSLPGFSGAMGQATGVLGTFKEASSSESATLETLGTGLGAIGVAVAGISFESFEHGAEDLHQLALQSGMTEANISGLQTAMGAAGVSADKLQTVVMIVSRNLQTMQQSLNDGKDPSNAFSKSLEGIGVQAIDSSGKVRSMGDLMPEIMDGFKAASESGVDALGNSFNAAGTAAQLFGRSGAALVPMLIQGSASVEEFTKAAEKMGIGSEAQIAKLEAWNETTATLKQQIQGFTMSLGADVAPTLTDIATKLDDVVTMANKWPQPFKDAAIAIPIVGGGVVFLAGAIESLLVKSAGLAASTASNAVSLLGLGAAAETTSTALVEFDAVTGEAVVSTQEAAAAIEGSTLSIEAAAGPIGLLIAGIGAAALAYHAFSSGADSAAVSQEDLTKAVQAALPPVEAQVAAWKAAGVSQADITSSAKENANAYGQASLQIKAAGNVLKQSFAELQNEGVKDVLEGNKAAAAALAPQLQDLSNQIKDNDKQWNDAHTSAEAWSNVTIDADLAAQAAATGLGKANDELTKAVKGFDQAGVSAAEYTAAQTNISGIVTAAATSQSAQTAAVGEYNDALKLVNSTGDEHTTMLANINAAIATGDPGQKTYAQNTKDIADDMAILTANGGNVGDILDRINNATTAGTPNLGIFGDALKGISDALDQVKRSADAANPALDKVSAEVANNTVQITAMQAELANGSPIDQMIAKLEAKRLQDIATGATTKQLATDTAELATQVQAAGVKEGAAHAAEIVSTQDHIIALQNENTGLDANKAHIVAVADAATANAKVQTDTTGTEVGDWQKLQGQAATSATAIVGSDKDIADATAITMSTGVDSGTRAAIGDLISLSQQFDTTATTAQNDANRVSQSMAQMAGARSTGTYASGGSGGQILSPAQIAQGLADAGMSPEKIGTQVALMLAESGGSTGGYSQAGAAGFGQLMPGFGGISEADRMGQTPEALQAQFRAIVAGQNMQGFGAWDPYSYVGGGDPSVNYGEINVGAGHGSYQNFLAQGNAAAAGVHYSNQLPNPAPDATYAGPNLGGTNPIPAPETASAAGTGSAASAGQSAAAAALASTNALDAATAKLAGDQATLVKLQTDYNNIIIVGAQSTTSLATAQTELSTALTGTSKGWEQQHQLNATAFGDVKVLATSTIDLTNSLGTVADTAGKSADDIGTLGPAGDTAAGGFTALSGAITTVQGKTDDNSKAFVKTKDDLTVLGPATDSVAGAFQQLGATLTTVRTGSEALAQSTSTLSDSVATVGSAATAAATDWYDAFEKMSTSTSTVSRKQVDDEGAAADALGKTAQALNLKAQALEATAASSQQAYQAALASSQGDESKIQADQDAVTAAKESGDKALIKSTQAQLKADNDAKTSGVDAAKTVANADQSAADLATKAADDAYKAWHDAFDKASKDAGTFATEVKTNLADIQSAIQAIANEGSLWDKIYNVDTSKGSSNPADLATAQANLSQAQQAAAAAMGPLDAANQQLLSDLNAERQAYQDGDTASAGYYAGLVQLDQGQVTVASSAQAAAQGVVNSSSAIVTADQNATRSRQADNATLDKDNKTYNANSLKDFQETQKQMTQAQTLGTNGQVQATQVATYQKKAILADFTGYTLSADQQQLLAMQTSLDGGVLTAQAAYNAISTAEDNATQQIIADKAVLVSNASQGDKDMAQSNLDYETGVVTRSEAARKVLIDNANAVASAQVNANTAAGKAAAAVASAAGKGPITNEEGGGGPNSPNAQGVPSNALQMAAAAGAEAAELANSQYYQNNYAQQIAAMDANTHALNVANALAAAAKPHNVNVGGSIVDMGFVYTIAVPAY